MHKIIYIFFTFRILSALAQSKTEFVFEELPLDSVSPPSINNHSSVKPTSQQTLKHTLIDDSRNSSWFGVQGITDAGFFGSVNTSFRLGGGILMESSPNNKWYVRVAGIQGITNGEENFLSQWVVARQQYRIQSFSSRFDRHCSTGQPIQPKYLSS